MSAQIAVIMSHAEFEKVIKEEVYRQLEGLKRSLTIERDLPVRMSCKRAAKELGISVSSFNRNFPHLKRYEGNTVFVLAKDLK